MSFNPTGVLVIFSKMAALLMHLKQPNCIYIYAYLWLAILAVVNAEASMPLYYKMKVYPNVFQEIKDLKYLWKFVFIFIFFIFYYFFKNRKSYNPNQVRLGLRKV